MKGSSCSHGIGGQGLREVSGLVFRALPELSKEPLKGSIGFDQRVRCKATLIVSRGRSGGEAVDQETT